MKSYLENAYLWMICTISALGGVLFGVVTGVIAGAAPLIQDHFHMTDFKLGLLVSIILLAAACSSFSSGIIIDKLGRKIALLISAMLFVAGSILGAFAANEVVLMLSRVIVGVALGISSFAVPMYISEIAPKDQRGTCVMLNSIGITSGIVIAYAINIVFAQWGGWRWMLGICALPAFGFGFGLCFLPESPRWLIFKHRAQAAKAILNRLMPVDKVEQEISLIETSIQSDNTHWKTLLHPQISKICLLGLGLAILQQICGINTIIYYTPILFGKVGFDGYALFLIPLLIGVVNLLMTLFALKYVDRWGRRALLLSGLKYMSLCLLVMAVCMHFEANSNIFDYALVVACLIYVGYFAMSIGCLFWLLISELYPTQIKAKAMGLMTASNWLANFAVTFSFLPLVHWLGMELTFAFYALACMIGFVFCKQWVPETKSIPLESIQANLMAGKKIREIGAPI